MKSIRKVLMSFGFKVLKQSEEEARAWDKGAGGELLISAVILRSGSSDGQAQTHLPKEKFPSFAASIPTLSIHPVQSFHPHRNTQTSASATSISWSVCRRSN